jgi:hydrogenase maturation protease
MRTIVLGIGNPIIGDDGVGFHVIEKLEEDPPEGDVTLTACDVSGLAILDLIVDFDRAVIVDAIQTAKGTPGQIYRLDVKDFMVTKHTISPHDVDLPTALDIGKMLELKIPGKIDIIGVEIPDALEFSTRLSDAVLEAVPRAVKMVREILAEG